MSECVNLVSYCQQGYREGYTLAISHGRPGISRQVSGVALPYTERTVNVDINVRDSEYNTQGRPKYLPNTHVCIYPRLLHVL